ncbi:circularly permuted type 2 ATP-grasp protein [Janibacter sp. G56]|uniref:circularly permuted type 2 ATP-grasp protein n=1 Tax=Janibacter sp. G56 TaxID=3418717 RepID=UPI003CFD591F
MTATASIHDDDPVGEAIASLGLQGLLTKAAETRRYIEDDGVTYGTGDPKEPLRDWFLDPLPLIMGAEEWAAIERGVRQRTHLLDAILTDSYGERRLLHERIVPAEAILGHAGYFPQADNIRLPGAHQLINSATDLALTGGQWVAYGDRTQAPSGAAYAMANRRIISRVLGDLHRRTDLARMRGFFDIMRQTLTEVAPPTDGPPRAVLLSPGPLSETAFDQAFTATLLGHPLVEAEDLTVRDGRVWLRTSGRLEPVDVVMRRVDADFVDPLELRGDSALGVPGFLEASRRGTVSVVNPIGAGVIENTALTPYLPQVCRALLGEDLLLPSPQTWWCGDRASMRHVLANLQSLVIKPIARGIGVATRFGSDLSNLQADELRAQIQAEPWRWSAQERLDMATEPVVTPDGLSQRATVVRTFAVAHGDDYALLPGGMARVSHDEQSTFISNHAGAPSKDVWVLASPADAVSGAPSDTAVASPGGPGSTGVPGTAPVTRPAPGRPTGAGTVPTPTSPPIDRSGLAFSSPAPRVAQDLFWLGRYSERAEGTARLLRVADDLVEDHAGRTGTPGASALAVVLEAVAQVTGVAPRAPYDPTATGAEAKAVDPLTHLRHLALDGQQRGSVAYAAARAARAAFAVREQMSVETWIAHGRLERTLEEAPEGAELSPLLAQVLESFLALAGIHAESMVRDTTWAFIDTGRRIERAQFTVRLLRHTLGQDRAPIVDGQVTESLLVACESVITHRRRMAAGAGPAGPAAAAFDLVLLDRGNPRSVTYQIDRIAEDLALVPEPSESILEEIAAIWGLLEAADADELEGDGRAHLRTLLDDLEKRLRDLSDAIDKRHFVRRAPARRLPTLWSTTGSGWGA